MESVTDWWHRYRSDSFFHTEVNVLTLQIIFGLVIFAVIGGTLDFLYHEAAVIISARLETVASQVPHSLGPSLIADIDGVKNRYLLVVTAVIVLTTGVFGYIVTSVALSPTRMALATQKKFIGNIAHEIRTPLAVIKTNTEVALMDKYMSDELREFHLSNVEELDRISQIINNLLSLSALIRPEQAEMREVDISIIVTQAVKHYTRLAKSNDQSIVARTSPRALIWGNATAIGQIVDNLIKNAVSYTPRGGHIQVKVERLPGNEVQFAVQDSGIGIAQEDLFHIFEPFYRSDQSRNRRVGGSGLGLTIVSELVKMHHGKIAIRSALNKGTTVTVTLPGVEGRGSDAESPEQLLHEIAVDFSV